MADEYFDLVISRHVLEHISNPIKALLEWRRVLRPGKYLYLSLPDRRKTHERLRKLTSLDHMISDYKNDVPIFDESHKLEIEETGIGLIDSDNYELPYIHFHTFEPTNIIPLIKHCGFKPVRLSIKDVEYFRYAPWDLIVLAKKTR